MQYREGGPRSAEVLRTVLPHISKSGAWYAPTAYAVWYEHTVGMNPRLSANLNSRLRKSPRIDEAAIGELYADFILSRQVGNSKQLRKSLEELARRLTTAATASSGSTEQYARALQNGQAELGAVRDAEDLQGVLGRLLTSTQDARTSVAFLQSELQASQQQLSDMRERIEQLESEATKDPLTGLLNRRGFDQAVSRLRSDDSTVLVRSAVLVLDLDLFKRINDTYGHQFGDQVLCVLAKVLNSVIKGRDLAARFGGEEFAVLLPETSQADAVAVAERFREMLGQTKVRRTDRNEVVDQIAVSIGVAVPVDDEPLMRSIERADRALYRAKQDGRNCVRVADPA
jgi:diguanylate cyclase